MRRKKDVLVCFQITSSNSFALPQEEASGFAVMSESKLLVTVIVPLHNKGQFVNETLRSLVSQSMEHWQAIVVENGSSDNGPETVRAYEDERVRLLVAPDNIRGPGAARNFGLDHVRSDWVLFLDADDLLEANHLENLVTVATEKGVPISVTGWREFRDAQPDVLEVKDPMGRGVQSFQLADDAIAFAPWAVHCALIRKRILTDEYRWPVELDPFASEDTTFWFKLVSQFPVAYSDKNTAIYRTHTDNYRNQFDDLTKWFDSMQAVTKANLRYLNSKNMQPDARQCETLMRLWADVSERAESGGSADIASRACLEAQQWLNRCRDNGGINSWPLRFRSALTIRRFLKLKRLSQKLQFQSASE